MKCNQDYVCWDGVFFWDGMFVVMECWNGGVCWDGLCHLIGIQDCRV